MTTDTLEPVYFAECRKALAAYYTGAGEKGASFLIKNIPGKLYKARLLYDGIPTADAVDLCTSYAANRSYLIKQGASPDKAGDMALDEMISPADPDDLTDKLLKEAEPMPEPAQQDNDVAAEYELTVFPSTTGAIYHKATGIALATSLQIRSNSPHALFYLPQQVEHLMENIQELVASGHYAINYAILAKEFRDNLEAQGLPPKQVNDLDAFIGDHPSKAQQGNATPKGNSNQAQQTRPTQTQQTQQGNNNQTLTAPIAQIELVTTKDGKKTGYRMYRQHEYQGKKELKPVGFGDYRLAAMELVLKAANLSFVNLPVGTKLPVNVNGLLVEYILDPQPDGRKFSKVVNYILPNGERVIKERVKHNAGDMGFDEDHWSNFVEPPY